MAKIGNIYLGDLPLLPAPMEDLSGSPSGAANKENGAGPMYAEFIFSEGLPRDTGVNRRQAAPVNAGSKRVAGGIAAGRGATGCPRVLNEIRHFRGTGEHLPPVTVLERVRVCKKHLRHPGARKGEVVGILEMRRHYTNYLKGLPHINDFKQQLVTCKTQAVTE